MLRCHLCTPSDSTLMTLMSCWGQESDVEKWMRLPVPLPQLLCRMLPCLVHLEIHTRLRNPLRADLALDVTR